MRVVCWGTASLTTYKVVELLEKRGELAGAVEGIARSSPGNERFYSGLIGKLRARIFPYSPYQKARRAGLPAIIYHSTRTSQLEQFLKETRPDVCVVASFPCLISESLFSLVRLGFINVHFSVLPAFRGPAAPLWECVSFSETAGATIHQLDAGEDTGDILCQETFQVEPGMDSRAFYDKHLEIALRLLSQTLDDFKVGKQHGIRQSHMPCKIRARRIKPDEEIIDWTDWPIERAYHVLRTGQMWHIPPQLGSGWRALFNWKASDYEICRHNKRPGVVGWDMRGPFVAHAKGKIRLHARFSLRKILWPLILGIFGANKPPVAAVKSNHSAASNPPAVVELERPIVRPIH